MTIHHRLALVTVCFGAFAAGSPAGCRRPEQTKPPTAVASASATARLAKIVFVGKEHACDCTRKTVDASWAALQKALGTPSKIKVETLHVDTEPTRVEPYRAQKPIMALPAIYFVDDKESVLDLVQGEVSEAQLQTILEKTR